MAQPHWSRSQVQPVHRDLVAGTGARPGPLGRAWGGGPASASQSSRGSEARGFQGPWVRVHVAASWQLAS